MSALTAQSHQHVGSEIYKVTHQGPFYSLSGKLASLCLSLILLSRSKFQNYCIHLQGVNQDIAHLDHPPLFLAYSWNSKYAGNWGALQSKGVQRVSQ